MLLRLVIPFIISFLSLFPTLALAEGALPLGNQHVSTRLVLDQLSLIPSGYSEVPSARIGVYFQIAPGWHIYWRNSGQAGTPTRIKWKLPEGWRAGELVWPAPSRFSERAGIQTIGYRDEVLLSADLFAPDVVPARDQALTISADVEWLVCKDICVPGSSSLALNIPLTVSGAQTPSDDSALFFKYKKLAPISLNEGRVFPLLNNLSIATGYEPQGVEIILSGLKARSNDEFREMIQIFPYTNIEAKVSESSLLDSELSKDNLSTVRLLLPMKGKSGTTNSSLGGIVVIAHELAGSPNDLAFEWQVAAGGIEYSSSNTHAPIPDQALTFRVIDTTTALQSTKETQSVDSSNPTNFSEYLLLSLYSAFLAGLILNLMPCVLPVVSIKLLTLVESREHTRRENLWRAGWYTFGVIVSFLVLASVIVLLKGAGSYVGWGFQFQSPVFVFGALVALFVFALSFFDVFYINLPGVSQVNRLACSQKSGSQRDFLDGAFATLLATPCSAPFLGSALTFAFSQNNLTICLIFVVIGLGLASPFLVIALCPALYRYIPKPGEWMNRFRELMGFLLLGSCVWLVTILNVLTVEGAGWALVVLLLVYVLLWTRRSFHILGRVLTARGRDALLILFLSMVILNWWPELTTRRGVSVSAEARGGLLWQPYSADLISDLTGHGKPVFIDFTAEWCVTCKANEKLVISQEAVSSEIVRLGVVPVKADYTDGSPGVAMALKGYGGQAVPYYVVISKSGVVEVLPTLLTPGTLIAALRRSAS